ncbi:MAG: FtsX-like permease family protein [Gammaproteobacteria bacterium]|nr:FtsX-like permease family protein [Gammaproteobacteria bacterium]NBT44607.1 FtsX-like permease family protein [Gammaproteobacteria bacterium]NBY23145.1 FtsX-like permease family protein [Gammaproteobacteria bacterium]NDE34133.1 FtsX-like permease family protein [Gammaproteobacteria bacterium]NDE56168.1 FtsX-like permease family protein [Gammaproteobacteria bacterium]
MQFSDTFIEASQSMGANRLRTGLTMLGMIIGVASVVLMLAIGQGAQALVTESIASMGSNLFIVLSGTSTAGGVRMGGGTVPTLTYKDTMAIGELESIAAVAPMLPNSAPMVYGANNWTTQVVGTTPDYFEVRDWQPSEGVVFTPTDLRSANRVVLLGKTVVSHLFGDENPIGKTLRIKNNPFTVVGVLSSKGQSLDGRDQDDTALIPFTTAQRKVFGNQFPGMVRYAMAKAASAEVMTAAEAQMNDLLRQRHRIRAGMDDDFSIRNLTALAQTAQGATKAMSMMLGAIAGVSLLVGGIGIMNIMLVSVTERTREIGIRMAIGARTFDILAQFLLEALMISLSGSLLGVVLGVTIAWLVATTFGMNVVVTLTSIFLAFGVAAAVGIFFGFYPARKAAALRPIEALRYQ